MRRKAVIALIAGPAIGLLVALPILKAPTGMLHDAPQTTQMAPDADVAASSGMDPVNAPVIIAEETAAETAAEITAETAAPPAEMMTEAMPEDAPALAPMPAPSTMPSPMPVKPVAGSIASAPDQPQVETALPTLGDTDTYLVQRVFWGTDRKPEPDDGAGVTFGTGRATTLALGTAQVTIPRTAHQMGKIERPLSITLFRVKIPLQRESRDKHLTIYKRTALSPSEFRAYGAQAADQAATYKGTALVFIHGFNFGFDEALYRTAQIAHDLDFDGPTYLYSWPSQDRLASYVTDTDSADRAAPFMDEFLDHVFETPGVERVHIIAHSMGNRALAGLLVRAGTRLSQRGRAFDQMILAAPDIDATVFSSVAQHFTNAAENVTLYACGNDRALLASRKLRDDFPRAGDVPNGGPIIVPGVDTIDVTGPGTTMFSMNHNAYAESRSVLADLRLIISKRLHPPALRMPSLQEEVLERGKYWLMAN